jgi:hypothetical protein
MARTLIPAVDRVLSRCIEDGGCWIFTGARSEGYGKIGLGGRGAGIDFCHRVTYRHLIGDIPEGFDLDHLCRRRACCNPWHTEPVPRLVNANRGLRARGYRDARCRNGHAYTPQTTRARASGYRECLICVRTRQEATA